MQPKCRFSMLQSISYHTPTNPNIPKHNSLYPNISKPNPIYPNLLQYFSTYPNKPQLVQNTQTYPKILLIRYIDTFLTSLDMTYSWLFSVTC